MRLILPLGRHRDAVSKMIGQMTPYRHPEGCDPSLSHDAVDPTVASTVPSQSDITRQFESLTKIHSYNVDLQHH